MDNTGYTTLSRQSGLMREMQTVANNIANVSTTGYRAEGVVFSEFVKALAPGEPSLSMAHANVRAVDFSQAALKPTGGTFDFGIEGEGFFLLETPEGQMLTRAGSFTPNQEGELVAPDGARLLDGGGAPIFVPPDARSIALATDGTLSADGTPINQIGLFLPSDPTQLERRGGARFAGGGEPLPVENAVILQGFVEGSNVNAVNEIARMIEVQHAYELGQKFLDQEHERVRSVMQTLGK
ncbi:Flagellar basal-body rod protein FlgG [Candidatus Rhodobacter oscarellae]|uniref:Flagellar basal-body rod protein FlgF n=1 Tax=Candidatus Rhodobacter oscarellae TaxID=1675527 RepID=A0A0J9E8V3_9RHOB|nr:flagellar hook-basal body complex protein [Candidatus Rhodobacter lobularis]KMW59210.1 Flagellar basal-body rod protein FlgG [Candidatus Rhodobacter lobularis]